jgi:hypothetical protein
MSSEEKPAKATKSGKPKKPRTHPKYEKMIAEAIAESKSRTGISRQAIKKFISQRYPTIPDRVLTVQLRLQLRYDASILIFLFLQFLLGLPSSTVEHFPCRKSALSSF